MFHSQIIPCCADACRHHWFYSVLNQVTFNDLVPVINLSDLPILAVRFPVTSTKHSWNVNEMCSIHILLLYRGVSVEQSRLTMYSTSGGETLTFVCVVAWDQASTAFVSFLSELDGIQCRRFEIWFANGCLNVHPLFVLFECSLEGDSDLTSGTFVSFFYPSFSIRHQHGPRACSMSPSFWQASDSHLCTSWVNSE